MTRAWFGVQVGKVVSIPLGLLLANKEPVRALRPSGCDTRAGLYRSFVHNGWLDGAPVVVREITG